jgi:hypothetical protein
MSTTTLHVEPGLHSEEAAIHRIVRDLATELPDVELRRIAHAVDGEYARYQDSRIRDFLPILVQRAVRDRLRSDDAPQVADRSA